MILAANLAFAQIKLFDATNSKLVDNDLQSISIDKKGNKWLGTSKNGLLKFDGENVTVYNSKNSGVKGDYIVETFVDSKGNVWVSYAQPNKGLAQFDGTTWTNYAREAIQIVEDKKGTLYFGDGDKISTYDGKKWGTIKLPVDPASKIIIRAIAVDDEGSIAVGHNAGLFAYRNQKWTEFKKDSAALRLGVVRAVKFYNGDLYVGYGGGVGDGGFSILDKGGKWTHFNKNNSKTPDHMVRDIEVHSGTFWMATNNGVIKKQDDTIEPMYFRTGPFKNVILDIEFEGDVMWIAANFGLVRVK